MCNKLFLYSDRKWLLQVKYTPLNVFLRNQDVCKSCPTLVIDMSKNAILLLCDSLNVNLTLW